MSKAFKAAKEKYDAVINDAGRGDYVCRSSSEMPKSKHQNTNKHAIKAAPTASARPAIRQAATAPRSTWFTTLNSDAAARGR